MRACLLRINKLSTCFAYGLHECLDLAISLVSSIMLPRQPSSRVP